MTRIVKIALCALIASLAIVACGGGSGSDDGASTIANTEDKLTIVGSGN